jgi:hypothetical protein
MATVARMIASRMAVSAVRDAIMVRLAAGSIDGATAARLMDLVNMME